jgi:SAM-dependent methyltransferase
MHDATQDAKQDARDLARSFADRGHPNGWFEEFYRRAGGDIHAVYWADLAPNPRLVSWVDARPPAEAPRAAVIGCGLGDDAEFLARRGYRVTAFDVSPSAIAMCRSRYPASAVAYRVADLFTPPRDWIRGFDLVYECNTIQILVGDQRPRALSAIAELVAPGAVWWWSPAAAGSWASRTMRFPCPWTASRSMGSGGAGCGRSTSTRTTMLRNHRCRTSSRCTGGAEADGGRLLRRVRRYDDAAASFASGASPSSGLASLSPPCSASVAAFRSSFRCRFSSFFFFFSSSLRRFS